MQERRGNRSRAGRCPQFARATEQPAAFTADLLPYMGCSAGDLTTKKYSDELIERVCDGH
jgi:hypothetical protein